MKVDFRLSFAKEGASSKRLHRITARADSDAACTILIVMAGCVVYAVRTPALRKVREGRATYRIIDASESQKPWSVAGSRNRKDGAGPPLRIHDLAAPCFAMFEAWAPRTMISGPFFLR